MSCGSGRVSVSEEAIRSRGANVAIIGFDMRNKKDNSPMPQVSDEFSDALVPSFMDSGFRVIERSKVNLLLKEHEFQKTGVVDSEHAVRVGKIAQVRFVVFGSGQVSVSRSGKLNYQDSASVKMVDVESGETAVAAAWSGTAVLPSEAAEKIGRDIVKKFQASPRSAAPGPAVRK